MHDTKLSIKPSTITSTMSIGRSSKRTRCDNQRNSNSTTINNMGAEARRISNVSSTAAVPSSTEPVDDTVYPSVAQSLPWLYGKESETSVSRKTTTMKQHQQLQQSHTLKRVNSKEWVREYKKERIDKINFNNVFGGVGDEAYNEIPALPPMNKVFSPDTHSKENRANVSRNHLSSPVSTSTASDSGSVHPMSPLSTASMGTGPSPADVICGRGGKANSHPGNNAFRAEALKLRSWYESSSKSEKFTISNMLVDFVRERGGRFLKRDKAQPGNWLEADGNDVRKKASQALREGKLKDVTP